MRKAYLVPVLAVALGFCSLALPTPASAQVAVGISVRIGPPALPVYEQPICPGPDYIWTPGYWAYGDDGYYWVPGTWVLAPEPGLLWTPGWWGYDEDGDDYVWHPGYWGPHVGFYGGINYGFGYFGVGFVGGEWRGDRFYYNREYERVNVNIVHNVYVNRTVERNVYDRNHVSFNGGPHGVNARPTAEDRRWDNERHVGRTAEQNQHDMQARNDRSLHYSDNHGRPPITATQRPGQFSGAGVERGRNQFHPPTNENRPHQNYQPRPNNRTEQPNSRRPEQPNFNSPRNQPNERGNPHTLERPQQRPQERPRTEAAPRGNPHPEARPHNEQPRGNQGGDHGHGGGGHDGGGRDDGHR